MISSPPWTTEGQSNIDEVKLFYLHITKTLCRWTAICFIQTLVSYLPLLFACQASWFFLVPGLALFVSVYGCVCVCVCVRPRVHTHTLSCSVVSNSLQLHGLQPARLLCFWDFSGKNTGVGCHFLHRVCSPPRHQICVSPTLAGRFLTASTTWKPVWVHTEP